ncbi:MAG: P63C domain-containing protein [Akkermansia muciniphila]
MAHQKKEEIQPIKAEFDDVSNALVAIPSEIRKALYEGKLPIGDIELDCAVLDNGIRVLSERAVHRSFKSKRGGSHWRRIKENPDGANLPSFLSAKNINPFISKELMMALSSPIKYMSSGGGTPANGIKADLIPDICEVWLEARRAGVLVPSQEHLAIQAEILMTAFAKVGIIALIDEATGYQYDRTNDALRLLLSKYVAKGLQKWLKIFPDAFFAQLDKLYHNAPTTPKSRPQYYGKFINRYVYNPIENGYVKAELDRLNITDEGKRIARFHQWLTDEGKTILTLQIGKVQGLMEVCTDIEYFKNVVKNQKKYFHRSIFIRRNE